MWACRGTGIPFPSPAIAFSSACLGIIAVLVFCIEGGRGGGPSFGSLFVVGSPLVSSACLANICSIVAAGGPVWIPKIFATFLMSSFSRTVVKLQKDFTRGAGQSALRIRKTVRESTGMVDIAMNSSVISMLYPVRSALSTAKGDLPRSLKFRRWVRWEIHVKPVSP